MEAAATARPYARYDDGLSSDEEERLLSAQHGEASDDSPNKRKRSTASNAKIATLTEEDAQAAAEFEEKVTRKKSRPILQPADLKGDKGLVFVRRSFPTHVRKFREVPFATKARGTGAKSHALARKINTQSQLKAAADFSRSLMAHYRAFAQELFPSLAPEDVFLKIEDLGAKKEVKDYLQVMRDEMRREHLEGIYGAERAGRILNELEHGLRVHPAVEKGYGGYDDAGKGAVMSRMGYAANDDDEEEEMGGGGGGGAETPPASPPVAVANPYAKTVEEAEKDGAPATDVDGAPATDGVDGATQNEAKAGEEEEEATFSDDGEEAGKEEGEKGATAAAADEAEPVDGVEMMEMEPKEKEPAAADKADDDDEEEQATFSVSGDDVDAEKAVVEEAVANEPNAEAATEVEKQTAVGIAEPEAEPKEGEDAKASEEPKNDEGVVEATEKQIEVTKANDEAPVEEAAAKEGDETSANNGPSVQFANDAGKTQETLTLVASQFDDVEMGYTQTAADDRFSQVDAGATNGGLVETPTQLWEDGYTQDVRFSQTQDERFSQAVVGEDGQEGNQEEGQNEDQENEADERFSQFTQGAALAGPVFEEDGAGNGDGGNDGNVEGSGDRLGQTMDTQLSMEY